MTPQLIIGLIITLAIVFIAGIELGYKIAVDAFKKAKDIKKHDLN